MKRIDQTIKEVISYHPILVEFRVQETRKLPFTTPKSQNTYHHLDDLSNFI